MLERDEATKNPSGMDRLESAHALLLTITRANAGVNCSTCGQAFWLIKVSSFRFRVSEEQ